MAVLRKVKKCNVRFCHTRFAIIVAQLRIVIFIFYNKLYTIVRNVPCTKYVDI